MKTNSVHDPPVGVAFKRSHTIRGRPNSGAPVKASGPGVFAKRPSPGPRSKEVLGEIAAFCGTRAREPDVPP